MFLVEDPGPPPLRPLSPPVARRAAPATAKALSKLDRPAASPAASPSSGRRYACHRCGKVYQHDQSLWRHSKFECGRLGTFQCPHCGHLSKRRAHLADHIQRLHGPKRAADAAKAAPS